ncbi:MAG: hypothetical protein CL908_06290 [Deltaproteobacteria bacterium]|nr:hypothetical protein [Deltaproteobacteria bacterium]
MLDARDERFDLGQALDSACGEGVTTVMVRLVACDGDRLRARMRQVTETGLRAVFALAPDTEGEQRSRRVGDALITSNALNRVRIAWLTDSAVEGDAFGVAERCFGRRLGVLTPGAVGDVVVRGRYGAPRHVVVAGRVLS